MQPSLSERLAARPVRGLVPALVAVCLLCQGSGALKLHDGLGRVAAGRASEVRAGDDALRRGSWRELLSKYHAMLSHEGSRAEADYHLGHVYLRLGLAGAAEVCFRRCLEREPAHVAAMAELGECLLRLRRVDEADATLARAAALQPGEARTDLCRGAVARERGRFDEALAHFRSARRAGGGAAAAVQEALCLYAAGRLLEAAARLGELLVGEPRLASAREALALVYVRQGRFRDARTVLRGAASEGAAGLRCRRLLAQVEAVLAGAVPEEALVSVLEARALPSGAVDERRRLLERARELAPTWSEPRLSLALEYVPGRVPEALEELRAAAAAAPDDAEVRYRLGLACHDGGRRSEALAALEAAADLAPRDPRVRVRLGLLLLEAGRHDEALRHLRRAIQLEPTEPRAYVAAARALNALGAAGEAETLLADARLLGTDLAPSSSGSEGE